MATDFLIIGGGIAGVSAAARLSHLGRVTLLEAEDNLAHHASGRSAALYEPNYGLAPVVALSHASGDALRAAGALTPRGIMLLGAEGAGDAFAAECRDSGRTGSSSAAARTAVPVPGPRGRGAALAGHA